MTLEPKLGQRCGEVELQRPQGAECIEVAPGFSAVPVRTPRTRAYGHLAFAPASWSALLSTLRTA